MYITTEKTHFTTINILNQQLWNECKKEAKRLGLTISQYIFRILNWYMKKEKEKKEPSLKEVMDYLGCTYKNH